MNHPPVRLAPDAAATIDPHQWGEPTKHCDRCGIDFASPGLQCIDCLDVLDMSRPGTDTAPPPPVLVIKPRGNRRVNSGPTNLRPDPARGARWRQQIPLLRARGLSDVEIALTVGCSDRTVWRIRNQLGIPPITAQHAEPHLRRAS